MNLVQIHPGEDYVWLEWRGRGDNAFRMNGERVKIMRKYKRMHRGNTKETGYCEVFLLDDEGEFKLDIYDEPKTREVRAADVAMLWDEYANERDRQQVIIDRERAERRKREEEYERQYQERRRVREEERQARLREQEEKKQAVLSYLQEKHNIVNNGRINVEIGTYNIVVTFNRTNIDEEIRIARESTIDQRDQNG